MCRYSHSGRPVACRRWRLRDLGDQQVHHTLVEEVRVTEDALATCDRPAHPEAEVRSQHARRILDAEHVGCPLEVARHGVLVEVGRVHGPTLALGSRPVDGKDLFEPGRRVEPGEGEAGPIGTADLLAEVRAFRASEVVVEPLWYGDQCHSPALVLDQSQPFVPSRVRLVEVVASLIAGHLDLHAGEPAELQDFRDESRRLHRRLLQPRASAEPGRREPALRNGEVMIGIYIAPVSRGWPQVAG
jgi:hypothetical protein